ncbi:hypothetical protein LINPERHAP1_LOCUS15569, partial [Linum perenne]
MCKVLNTPNNLDHWIGQKVKGDLMVEMKVGSFQPLERVGAGSS